MNLAERFRENLRKWSATNEEAAHKITQLKGSEAALRTNPDGTENILLTKNGKEFPLHAEKDPLGEAKTRFGKISLSDKEVIFIVGIGLGYDYDALKPWLREDKDHILVFLEPDLEVIKLYLGTERASDLLDDPQVRFFYLDPEQKIVQALGNDYATKKFAVFHLKSYEQFYASSLASFVKSFTFYMSMVKGIDSEYSSVGNLFFRNYFPNMRLLPQAYLGNKFFGKFKGVPAIICGAGPSLAKNLQQLPALSDRALIFAGGTAMNALNTIGLLPHFGVGIDPNNAHFTRLIMNQGFETPYFYRNRLLNNALQLIHGDHLFVTGSGGYPIGGWFEHELGLDYPEIDEGYNVVNFSLSLAHEMGCSPIILVGVDLAYTNEQSYIPGIAYHPLHSPSLHFQTKSSDEEIVITTDIYGMPTQTLHKWMSESLWYTKFVKDHPESVVINATEGGIGFRNVPNMTLKDTADQYVKQELDLDGLISCVTQNSQMPPSASLAAVDAALAKMKNSLVRCFGHITSFIEGSNSVLQGLQAGKKPEYFVFPDPLIEILKQFCAEDAYDNVLLVFQKHYRDTHKEAFRKFLNPAYQYNETEVAIAKVENAIALYQFLKNVVSFAVKIIVDVETRVREEQVRASLSSSPEGVEHAPKTVQTLDDRPPAGSETFEQHYPSGAILERRYTVKGQFTGPSSFYAEDGSLLSQSIYKNGKREGNAFTFYGKGVLRSSRNYRNGVLDGVQKNYYRNGSIKSILPYSDGKLDGKVSLFYPSGKIKREIHFEKGKRHGVEHIWNESGMLVIEAFFDQDSPIGRARHWYNNGNLAFEAIYEKGDPKPVVREWDVTGVPRKDKIDVSMDFFDRLNIKTKTLTNSLQRVFQEVTGFAKVLELALEVSEDPNKQDANKISKELSEIGGEMQKLHEATEKLSKAMGGDALPGVESLWKGPGAKTMVEGKIDEMSLSMGEGIHHIQKSLKEALDALKQKLEKKERKDVPKKDSSGEK